MNNRDYKFFEMARKMASESDFERFHVGCVIVYKGRVIGQGVNSNKTDPKQKKYNRYRNFSYSKEPIKHSLHAEIAALKSVPYPIKESIDWKKAAIYIYRICAGRELGQGMARPCPACMEAMRDMGIQSIYYTTTDGFSYERIF